MISASDQRASEARHKSDGHGKTVVITGTGGLGYEAALSLAHLGYAIILAGRNHDKGAQAVASLQAAVSSAQASFEYLDLADLTSVKDFSARLLERQQRIDVLLNNAGIMSPPQRQVTQDGYELQFGVNYLGHFALTAQLLPLLQMNSESGARVVNVTSLAQHYAKPDLTDLQSVRRYSPGKSYCISKLLQAIFTAELQRRSDALGWGITSLAAHPGFAATNLFEQGKGSIGNLFATHVIGPILGQSAEAGARSLVHAACTPDVTGGALYGPTGFLQMKGPVGQARYAKPVHDRELASHLWALSCQLGSVEW